MLTNSQDKPVINQGFLPGHPANQASGLDLPSPSFPHNMLFPLLVNTLYIFSHPFNKNELHTFYLPTDDCMYSDEQDVCSSFWSLDFSLPPILF